jgi:hypothetical protein
MTQDSMCNHNNDVTTSLRIERTFLSLRTVGLATRRHNLGMLISGVTKRDKHKAFLL